MTCVSSFFSLTSLCVAGRFSFFLIHSSSRFLMSGRKGTKRKRKSTTTTTTTIPFRWWENGVMKETVIPIGKGKEMKEHIKSIAPQSDPDNALLTFTLPANSNHRKMSIANIFEMGRIAGHAAFLAQMDDQGNITSRTTFKKLRPTVVEIGTSGPDGFGSTGIGIGDETVGFVGFLLLIYKALHSGKHPNGIPVEWTDDPDQSVPIASSWLILSSNYKPNPTNRSGRSFRKKGTRWSKRLQNKPKVIFLTVPTADVWEHIKVYNPLYRSPE